MLEWWAMLVSGDRRDATAFQIHGDQTGGVVYGTRVFDVQFPCECIDVRIGIQD